MIDPDLINEEHYKIDRNQARADFRVHFVCSKCENVAIDPVTCSTCKMVYCKNCQPDADAGEKCSICDSDWDMEPLKAALQQELNEAKFECPRCHKLYKYGDH